MDVLPRLRYWLVFLLAFSLPVSNSLKLVCIYALFLVAAAGIVGGRPRPRLGLLHYGLLAMLAVSILSSLFADDTVRSFKGVYNVFYYSVAFFSASMIDDEIRARRILWALFLSSTAVAAWGVVNSARLGGTLELLTLGNENYTAMYFLIVLMAVLGVALFSEHESGKLRIVLAAFSVVLVSASIMTAMRSSFIALAVFFATVAMSRRRGRAAAMTLPAILGIVVLAAAMSYFNHSMWEKLFTIKSLVNRFYIWEYALGVVRDNPVLGIGFDHFAYTFPSSNAYEAGHTLYDAHSIYFQTAVQTGSAGLLALGLIVAGFLRIWSGYANESGFRYAVGLGAFGGFLVTFVSGVFDTTLHHEHAIVFMLLAGLMSGLSRTNAADSDPDCKT